MCKPIKFNTPNTSANIKIICSDNSTCCVAENANIEQRSQHLEVTGRFEDYLEVLLSKKIDDVKHKDLLDITLREYVMRLPLIDEKEVIPNKE